jgi:hypothetical protein
MTFNWSPNWAAWAQVCKSVGGFTTAGGAALGGVTLAVAPMAAAIPALAPAAGVVAAIGLILHGVGTGAEGILKALQAQGLDKQGPK